MRVLFVACPSKSVLPYLVPLGWALRTAGHEVRVASRPEFTAEITATGLTAVGVGRSHDIWRAFGVSGAERDALRMGLLEPYNILEQPPEYVSWHYLKTAYGWSVPWWHKMENAPMIADLVAYARFWQPDLIIWEPTAYAAPIAAKACGAAHARLLCTVDMFGVARDHFLRLQPPGDPADPLGEWLGGWAGKYGSEYSEDMACGHFTIDQLPTSLQVRADLEYVSMRYVPFPEPIAPSAGRVAVLLNEEIVDPYGGYPCTTQEILSSVDIEFTDALTPECAAVIHSAGAGIMSTAALYGVPQLVMPWEFDEPALADKLAARNAAIHLQSADAATVRESLMRLLDEPSFTRGARAVRDEMLALPSPNEIVGRLEELTAKYGN